MRPPFSPTEPSDGAPARGATAALDRAIELALLAPSVHDTQPWLVERQGDRLVVRADGSRQLSVLDPTGRELVQSVGAAVLNVRVGFAAEGWAADVDRLPDPGDPGLLAVVRPAAGRPDAALADLAPAVPLRRTNRRAYTAAEVPDDVLRGLATGAAAEGALLVPVLHEMHRRLLARLTRQADRLQNADPSYRAELRRWTDRRPEDRDGVPAAGLPAQTSSGAEGTLVVLATPSDDPLAWLQCGEAVQRVLLELALLGWVASPFTQLIEVPLTRTQLRSALSWDAHPQMLLRIGHVGPTPATPRRPREEVLLAVGR